MASAGEIQAEVRRLHAQLLAALREVEPAALHFHPDDNAWSVAQIVAHVAEFEHFFSADVLRLRDHPGSRFGRTMEHEARLAAVNVNGRETLDSLLHKLQQSERQTLERIGHLSGSDLAVTGTNPKFGEKTIEWELRHFITEHLQSHIGQLQRTYAAYRNAHV